MINCISAYFCFVFNLQGVKRLYVKLQFWEVVLIGSSSSRAATYCILVQAACVDFSLP